MASGGEAHNLALGITRQATMSEHLRAPHFGSRVSKRVLAVVIIGLLPALIALIIPGVGIPTWFAVTSFIVGGVVAGYLSIGLLRQFRCPRCGGCIEMHEATQNQENAPILYFCRPCDVVWDSGLRTPSIL